MMSKYKFSPAQRYAIFKTFDGICQWCRQPLDYSSFHVDHVLPESLLDNPAKRDQVLKSYNLDSSFNINDYENWAPLHSSCNQLKSASSWEDLGLIKTILDRCQKNKEQEQRIEIKINADISKGDFLAKLQSALEMNLLNIYQLQKLMLKSDVMDVKDEELEKLGQELQNNVSYQTDQMIGSIMATLRDNTDNELIKMANNLGTDWATSVTVLTHKNPKDSPYVMRYSIYNKINAKYTAGLTIQPTVENKQLVIVFEDNSTEIYRMSFDLENGVDYSLYLTKLRELYKDKITKNIRS